MDAATMREAGYRVSGQVSDEEVNRAYADVGEAYLRKVYDFERPTGVVMEAAMQLTYILLLQRHAVATRSGGKTKTAPTMSDNAYPTQQDLVKADMLLRRIQETVEGAVQGNPSELVDDICGIYFRNVFMAM